MRASRTFIALAFTVCVALVSSGCGKHKGGDGHAHDEKSEKGESHEHDETPSGAAFKAGKGVTLTEETGKILDLQVADVAERKLPKQLRFSMQVFGEKHHHSFNQQDHSGCDVHGSGLVTANAAAAVKAGQPVQLLKGTNRPLAGVVVAVQKALALGDSEIVVGVSNGAATLKPGEFVSGTLNLPREETVTAVQRSAVLRTAEGAFVYVVNGDAFLRTPVKTGSESEDWIEITDGLLPGDQVVTKPVETLWLIELRATKGGGHSH